MKIIDLSDKVPGLILVEGFINDKEEQNLIEATNKGTWSGLGIG